MFFNKYVHELVTIDTDFIDARFNYEMNLGVWLNILSLAAKDLSRWVYCVTYFAACTVHSLINAIFICVIEIFH